MKLTHSEHVRGNYHSPDCSLCYNGSNPTSFLFDDGEADISADEQRVKKLEARIKAPLRA